MIDYAEEIFESIKTIAQKELGKLTFDTTIEATISDISKAKYGVYTVRSGSAYFTAYSSVTDYREKDVVLVTIPKGDYTQQKIIIGKKNNVENEVPLNYTAPFSQIIDITNNLVSTKNLPFEIIANSEEYKWESSDENEYLNFNFFNNKYQHNLIWSARQYNVEAINNLNEIFDTISTNFNNHNNDVTYNQEYYTLLDYCDEVDSYFDDCFHFAGTSNNDIENLKKCVLSSDVLKITDNFKEETGITRIGLKADFKTLLKQYNTLSGNYGLILCAGFKNPDQPDKKNITHSTIIQPFIFDSKDFFGNIYNFETYRTQEAVFDISTYSNLILSDLFLFAYQKGNFKNRSGENIPVQSTPNIFIDKAYVCLGKELSNFNKDSLELFSFSETAYNKKDHPESNNKKLQLRWIHKDENTNTIKSILEGEEFFDTYQIRWYKYVPGARSTDDFIEDHWINYYGPEGDLSGKDYTTNKLEINFETDISKEKQMIQAAVIKINSENNGISLVARSNILQFNNEQEVDKDSIIKNINALDIQFNDKEKGKYYIYDSFQSIQSEKDSVVRTLTAVFSEDIYNKKPLQTYTKIAWIFPSENSMIIPLDYEGIELSRIMQNSSDKQIEADGYNYTISYNSIYKYYSITHIYDEAYDKDDTFKKNEEYISIPYKISKSLNFNYGRNTVYLELEKDGQTYLAQATMDFNISGTSGSNYNIIINWDNNKNVFDIGNDEEKLSGQVILLDSNQSEVDLNDNAKFEYSWYKREKEDTALEIITDKNQIFDENINSNPNDSFFIIQKKNNTNLTMDEIYILEIKLINFGSYNLTIRTPIPLSQLYLYDNKPIRKSENIEPIIFDEKRQRLNIDQVEGATSVRYETNGTVNFDKSPYNIILQFAERLQKDNGDYIVDFNWKKIITSSSESLGYWKIISKRESSFVKDLCEPILITTNNNIFENEVQPTFNNTNGQEFIYRLMKLITTINNEKLQLKSFASIDFNNLYLNLISSEWNEKDFNNKIEDWDQKQDRNNIGDEIDEFYKFFTNKVNGLENTSNLILLFIRLSKKATNDDKDITKILLNKDWRYCQKKNITLSPPSFYDEDETVLYAIQFIYNNNQTKLSTQRVEFEQQAVDQEIPIWTQPLYFYQNNYPSPTLNNWDGKLQINESNNIIAAKSFMAGKKDNENTFSGVVLGDWSEDNLITSQTGIYGFNKGKMTYALKEDGSAFFGNEKGKISLNANNSINLSLADNNNKIEITPGSLLIQSKKQGDAQNSNFVDLLKINKDYYFLQSYNFSSKDQTGMNINLQQGAIEAYNFSLLSKNSKNDVDYTLRISDGKNNNPFLQIGRERKSKLLVDGVEAQWYTQLIYYRQRFLNYRDELFNALIDIISFLNQVDIPLDGTNKNKYDFLGEFQIFKTGFEKKFNYGNLIRQSRAGVIEQIKNNVAKCFLEEQKGKIISTNDNQYDDWYFGEFPNSFLQVLTEEQKEQLVNAIYNTYIQNNKYFTIDNAESGEIPSKKYLFKRIFDEDISEQDYIKNLYYFKYPTQLIKKYKSGLIQYLYNNEISNYQQLLAEVEAKKAESSTQQAEWDDNTKNDIKSTIFQLNTAAKKIIDKHNILQTEEIFDVKQNKDNYMFNSFPIDGEVYNYISFNADMPILFGDMHNKLENEIEESSGYYLSMIAYTPRQNVSLEDHPSFLYRYKDYKFEEKTITINSTTITYYESKLFKSPSIDFKPRISAFYRNNALTAIGTERMRIITNSLMTEIMNAPGVRFYLFKNKNELDTVSEYYQDNEDYEISGSYITLSFKKISGTVANTENTRNPGGVQLLTAGILNSSRGATGLTKVETFYYNLLSSYIKSLDKIHTRTCEIAGDELKLYYNNTKILSNNIENKLKEKIVKNNKSGYLRYPINQTVSADELYLPECLSFNDLLNYYKITLNNNSTIKTIQPIVIKDANGKDIIADDIAVNFRDPASGAEYYQLQKIEETNTYYYIKLYDYYYSYQNKLSNQNTGSSNDVFSHQLNTLKFIDYSINLLDDVFYPILKEEVAQNSTFVFDEKNWQNDLIKIDRNGGYITSKDYRPTMAQNDSMVRSPSSNQENYDSNAYSQGMKGFVIDLTNNRIFLGNNSSIQGVQTQYYPGQTNIDHRHFIISTGVSMYQGQEERDKITSDNKWFILAQAGPTSGRSWPFRQIFGVTWDGIVKCRGIEYLP